MVNHLLRSARTIAFVGTDLDGRITLFNTGAEHMLGIDADARRRAASWSSSSPPRTCDRYAAAAGQTAFEAIVDHAAGDLAPETRDWTLAARRPRTA